MLHPRPPALCSAMSWELAGKQGGSKGEGKKRREAVYQQHGGRRRYCPLGFNIKPLSVSCMETSLSGPTAPTHLHRQDLNCLWMNVTFTFMEISYSRLSNTHVQRHSAVSIFYSSHTYLIQLAHGEYEFVSQ